MAKTQRGSVRFKLIAFILIAASAILLVAPTISFINAAARHIFSSQELDSLGVSHIVPIFNSVDLYQKNGVIEVYGGTLYQRHGFRLRISATEMRPDSSEQWVIWTPDSSLRGSVNRVEIALDDIPNGGVLQVGLVNQSNKVTRWGFNFGAKVIREPDGAVENLTSEEKQKLLAGSSLAMIMSGKKLIGQLPTLAKWDLADGNIKSFFVRYIPGVKKEVLKVHSLKFLGVEQGAKSRSQITGKVSGSLWHEVTHRPREAELVDEAGVRRTALIDQDGSFRFSNLEINQLASVRVRVGGRDFYAHLGRWFEVDQALVPVVVVAEPEWKNSLLSPIDERQMVFRNEGPTEAKPFAHYLPHAKMSWPGSKSVQEMYRIIEPLREVAVPPHQEFLGIPFTNNFGFPDRDRFFENEDNCLRIADVGGSSSVAIQVKNFQKYSFILEQILAPKVDRCVEVISAGRDNGDIGAVYPIVKSYIAKMKPDILLLTSMQLLDLQLEKSLLRKIQGWDYDHSPIDHFDFSSIPRGAFATYDPNWGLYAMPNERKAQIDEVPLIESLALPWEDLEEHAQIALNNMIKILRIYKKEFPDTSIFLVTGGDQARCRLAKTCGPVLKLPNGNTIRGGANFFIENMLRVCTQAGVKCINPEIPIEGDIGELLTYIDDGHFSIRGHQWMAEQLAQGLLEFLGQTSHLARKNVGISR